MKAAMKLIVVLTILSLIAPLALASPRGDSLRASDYAQFCDQMRTLIEGAIKARNAGLTMTQYGNTLPELEALTGMSVIFLVYEGQYNSAQKYLDSIKSTQDCPITSHSRPAPSSTSPPSDDNSSVPFGIPEGTPTDQLKIIKEIKPFIYTIVPKTSSSTFVSLVAVSTPETGVCGVGEYSKTFDSDANGGQVRHLFDATTVAISKYYGESRLVEPSHAETDSQNYWTASIYKNERIYQRLWSKESNATLHNRVQSISLQVKAYNSSQTYLMVLFFYDNYGRCQPKLGIPVNHEH